MRIETKIMRYAFALMGLTIGACSDEAAVTGPLTETPDVDVIRAAAQTTTAQACTVTPTSSGIRATMAGGTVKIKLTVPRTTCANYRLKTEDGSSWARVTSTQPVRGTQTISIAVAKNTGAERTVRMVITDLNGKSALGRFSLVQAGAACASVKLSTNRFDAGNAAASTTVSLTAPAGCEWTAASNQSFATVSPKSGKGSATLTLSTKATTVTRTAQVTTTDKATKAVLGAVSVVQTYTSIPSETCSISMQHPTLSMAAVASSATSAVTFGRVGCTVRVNSSQSWLTIAPAQFQSNVTLGFTAAANAGVARTASLTWSDVTTGRVLATTTVTQAGAVPPQDTTPKPTCTSVVLSPTSVAIPDTARVITATVSASDASCTGTIASNQSWATVTPSTFTGTATVRITAAANTSTSSVRTATITARLAGGANDRLTIEQNKAPAPCVMTLKSTTASFTNAGGTSTVDLTRSSTCETPALSVSASWLSASMPTTTSLRVTAASHTATQARSGEVRLTDPRTGNVLAWLTVQQAAAPKQIPCSIAVDKSAFEFTTAYNAFKIQVTPAGMASACASWSVISSESWISITGGSNFSGPATINATVSANATVNTRAGTLTIRGTDGLVQIVQIVQKGHSAPEPKLTVLPKALDLSKSYQQVTLQVTAAASECYSVRKTADWLTLPGGTNLCGSKSIPLYVDFNTGAARSAVVMVGDTAVPVTQAGTR